MNPDLRHKIKMLFYSGTFSLIVFLHFNLDEVSLAFSINIKHDSENH